MTEGTGQAQHGGTKKRRGLWIATLILLCAVFASTSAVAQNARSTATVIGRVFAGDTGKPLRGALVNIIDTRAANPIQRQGRWIATDASGRWELRDLAPGRYMLSVSKSGYLNAR